VHYLKLAALAFVKAGEQDDMTAKFKVTSVDYYDNDGRIIRRYLVAPLVLGPFMLRKPPQSVIRTVERNITWKFDNS
jgi:hypothetical protein